MESIPDPGRCHGAGHISRALVSGMNAWAHAKILEIRFKCLETECLPGIFVINIISFGIGLLT